VQENNDPLSTMTDDNTFYDSELAVHLIFRPSPKSRPMISVPVVSKIWQNEGLKVSARICEMDPNLDCWTRSIFSADLGPAIRRIESKADKLRYIDEICQSLKSAIGVIAELFDWPTKTDPHFARTTLKDGGHHLKLSMVFNWSARHVHPDNVFSHIDQLTQLLRDKVVAVEAPVNLKHYTELEDRPSLMDE